MTEWLTTSWESVGMIALSTIVIYAAVIILTRIVGLRSFSKMSSFDFAMTVAVGSVIASTVLTKNPPLLQGVAGLVFIYLFQFLISFLRKKTGFEHFVDNSPMLLMDGQTICWKNMKRGRITKADLFSKLREANVLDISQVRAVVLETTGDIAVLHTDDENKELQSDLLEGVER